MPRIVFDKEFARKLLRSEAAQPLLSAVDRTWASKVERLSELCDSGGSKTHIAFLITTILAKCLDENVDLFAIKPEHASDAENSYSARTLCHTVIVPAAAELGFHIGVTGREPLNNQPYFRMKRLDDGTPIQSAARPAFQYLLELVRELSEMSQAVEPLSALRAFISVRRKYLPSYGSSLGTASVPPNRLATLITEFVLGNSEGGRRAQAVAAGLLDLFAGKERVHSGRINDPSRHYPGDVCISSIDSLLNPWPDRRISDAPYGAPATTSVPMEKAFEVRDKAVSEDDVRIFVNKCLAMGVTEAAVVMVSPAQEPLRTAVLADWALGIGVGLTLFEGWPSLVDQVLFWSSEPKISAPSDAVASIRSRLIEIESSVESVRLWDKLTSPNP